MQRGIAISLFVLVFVFAASVAAEEEWSGEKFWKLPYIGKGMLISSEDIELADEAIKCNSLLKVAQVWVRYRLEFYLDMECSCSSKPMIRTPLWGQVVGGSPVMQVGTLIWSKEWYPYQYWSTRDKIICGWACARCRWVFPWNEWLLSYKDFINAERGEIRTHEEAEKLLEEAHEEAEKYLNAREYLNAGEYPKDNTFSDVKIAVIDPRAKAITVAVISSDGLHARFLTFTIDEKTRVRVSWEPAKPFTFADVRKGDTVSITYKNDKDKMVAVEIDTRSDIFRKQKH